MSKTNYEYCRYVRLIGIGWLALFLNFHVIENLWRIIKVQICVKHHEIWLLESMEEVIKIEWEKLKEE